MAVKMRTGEAGIDPANLEAVLAGFWKVKGSTAAKAEAALKRAGEFLLKSSQELVPVEYGDLKASGYVKANGTGFSTKVSVGYSSPYALHVHELIGMVLKGLPRLPNPPHRGRYWDPQGKGQAKFLEEPARRLQPEMRKIIYGEFLK